ncbi:hypothetical protein [Sinimarinibacterium flocculans]|uniref:NHL repeat-containing protein n=1 Tax=Sinimarinibacterium flocculans TaxID=985250 RepID=A0A318E3G4_9GAMM|nr:hypothetical protein [Sinimarinibacterium flocculans]PXV65688.1 NHL repeat-containing protein [Sinimarinibacterium flocculans]
MSATVLRVGLTPALHRGARPCGLPALDRAGPRVRIGGADAADGLAAPVRPGPATLFGPRGACLAGETLWICDTGHHRLLGWAQAPARDDAPADWVIGQPDFEHEGRNAKGAVGAATLNVPTGIAACGDGLAVADAWNHRVLVWHRRPQASHVPADVVLGQADAAQGESNRGQPQPRADRLFWPYGVHWDGAHLWVADSGNRRVLMWRGLPSSHGQPADLVLGQRDFDRRDENGGGEPDARSMRWPHAIATWNGRVCVADAGNNRVMVWNGVPAAHGAACDHLLGQRNVRDVDHNQSLYWPSAGSLNMPYGLCAAGDWLLAADTANSRILAWHVDDLGIGAEARALSGQYDFNAKGDNRWQMPAHDSLCWPYGVTQQDGVAVVADSGNNRVLLWPVAPELVR